MMTSRTIRILHDKKNNRLAIHDVDNRELLHVFYPTRDLKTMNPQQMQEAEAEALRDFMVNGNHGPSNDEAGW